MLATETVRDFVFSVLGLVHKVIDGVQFALWNLTD